MRTIVGCLAVLLLLVVCTAYPLNPYASATPFKQGKAAVTDAKALFAKNCATCHGKDGQAKTFKAKFNHARDLTDPVWQAAVSDERIFNSISQGKGKMPAWGKKLSEAEINALVAFVRQLKK